MVKQGLTTDGIDGVIEMTATMLGNSIAKMISDAPSIVVNGMTYQAGDSVLAVSLEDSSNKPNDNPTNPKGDPTSDSENVPRRRIRLEDEE